MKKWCFSILLSLFFILSSCEDKSLFTTKNPPLDFFYEGEISLPYVKKIEWEGDPDGSVSVLTVFSKPMEKTSVEENTFVYRVTGDIQGGVDSVSSTPEGIDNYFWDDSATTYIVNFKPSQEGQFVLIIKKNARDIFSNSIDGLRYGDGEKDFAYMPSDFVSSAYSYGNAKCPSPEWSTGKCYTLPSGGAYVRLKGIYVFTEMEYPYCNYYCPGPSPPQGVDCGLIDCDGIYDGCYVDNLLKVDQGSEERYFRIDFDTPFPPGIDLKSLDNNIHIYDFNTGEEINFLIGLTYTAFQNSIAEIEPPSEGVKHIYIKPTDLTEGKTYYLSINSYGSITDKLGIPLRDEKVDGDSSAKSDDEIKVYFATLSCRKALTVSDYWCSNPSGESDKYSSCTVIIESPSEQLNSDKLNADINHSFVCASFTEDEKPECKLQKPVSSDCCKDILLQSLSVSTEVVKDKPSYILEFKFNPVNSPLLIFLSHSISDSNGLLLDGNGNGIGEGNYFDDWLRIIE